MIGLYNIYGYNNITYTIIMGGDNGKLKQIPFYHRCICLISLYNTIEVSAGSVLNDAADSHTSGFQQRIIIILEIAYCTQDKMLTQRDQYLTYKVSFACNVGMFTVYFHSL